MAEMMYREALNRALFEEMERDPLVFVMGEGIAERGGSYKVTEGLLKKFGPERTIDTPLAEATFTGAGVGAALVGARPIVEILFVDFTTIPMDMIVNQAAKYEFMSGGQGRVPMVLRTQGGVGSGIAAQHSQSLEAIFYHIPGLKLVMPSSPYDACGLLNLPFAMTIRSSLSNTSCFTRPRAKFPSRSTSFPLALRTSNGAVTM